MLYWMIVSSLLYSSLRKNYPHWWMVALKNHAYTVLYAYRIVLNLHVKKEIESCP